jgi:hypothetical protein
LVPIFGGDEMSMRMGPPQGGRDWSVSRWLRAPACGYSL